MLRDRTNHNRPGSARIFNQSITLFLVSLIAAVALSMAGCGKGSGANSLHVKSPATGEKDMPVKSGYAFAVTKSFTDIAGKITTAASYRVYAANYDLDSSFFAQTLDKPLTSDDRMRIVFSLVGDEGTNDKSPLKAGAYSAKADKFMKVEDVAIVTRRGGQDNKQSLDRSTLSGDVKVTAASADSTSFDVDLTSGDSSIKGSFTGKILTRK
jgi:hypothetical protein